MDNYSIVFPHLCPQMWMNHSGVLSALSFKASRAAQCFSGAVRLMCCLLASETLARTGVRGRLVVLEARVRSKGRGLAGPGRSLVSTALTSTPHRRCTPKKNRRIPTIPTGCFGSRLVHVSAVDTGPRGSESGVLGGTARRRRGVEPPPRLSPTLRRLPRPAPATWGPITRHQRHDLKHQALSGARAKARWSWFDPGSAPSRLCPAPAPSRSTPRGSGSTGQGLCVLHEGPTYPKYPRPSSSGTPPSCSTSRRHRPPPQSPGRPPPTSPSSSPPLRQTHPGGVLRSHDTRNSQKS